MSSNELMVAKRSDLEIVMSRVFDAPRQLVFEAHSKCEHLKRWWGRGHELSCELDFRPGGSYRFVEHTPDGEQHAFRGEFREIVAPERIVQTFEWEGLPGHISVDTLVFTEENGRTTVTGTTVFTSIQDRDGMFDSGMADGAAESYRHLDAHLKTMV